MAWSEYWKEILSLAEQDGVVVKYIDDERLEVVKEKFKKLWKKEVDAYEAYERLLDLFQQSRYYERLLDLFQFSES